MRISYRTHGGNKPYWEKRWNNVDADSGALNLDRYPGKYAEQTLNRLTVQGTILEAGCGAGRVLRYYHNRRRDIVGIDFIATALPKIGRADPTVPLVAADIEKLPFSNGEFAAVLAFGLYHNLENGPMAAITETRRVIKSDGLLCAAMRLDNLQNRVIDWIADRTAPAGPKYFHKSNYTKDEWVRMVSDCRFAIEEIYFVENMPFLYKFRFFRKRSQKQFDENRARSEGYQFSLLGNALQKTLVSLLPRSFCNGIVIIARAI